MKVGCGLVLFHGHNLKIALITKSFSLPVPNVATAYNAESEVIPKGINAALFEFKTQPFTEAYISLDMCTTRLLFKA